MHENMVAHWKYVCPDAFTGAQPNQELHGHVSQVQMGVNDAVRVVSTEHQAERDLAVQNGYADGMYLGTHKPSLLNQLCWYTGHRRLFSTPICHSFYLGIVKHFIVALTLTRQSLANQQARDSSVCLPALDLPFSPRSEKACLFGPTFTHACRLVSQSLVMHLSLSPQSWLWILGHVEK